MARRVWAVMSMSLITSFAGLDGCHAKAGEPSSDTAALAKPDRSWIELDGTVEETRDNSFELNFGDGVITVEMDNWKGSKQAQSIRPNDKVIVYGRIDRELHRRKAVDAAGVYDERLRTTYFASPVDEQAVGLWPQTHVSLGEITVSGRITSISGKLLELDTGAGGKVTIDLSQLGYDPLDPNASNKLEVGDRMRVVGKLESAYFASDSLVAVRINRVQQLKQRDVSAS